MVLALDIFINIEYHKEGIMKITCIVVGKIKERYLVMAIEEYSKRLSRYCKLVFLELPDEKTPDHASELVEEQIKQKEGERILKALKEDAYVIALAIEGYSHIVFIIGGSLGLSKEVLARADTKLSFSRLTFPHQLMRVILLEQIYRAFRIQYGEPYHK